jgi:glycyl-tRNA synthetase alpha chain
VEMLFKVFDMFENEAKRLVEKDLILPAYDYALKCSHIFNILDARGAISVQERARYIRRIRSLTFAVAKKYTEKLEEGVY